MSAPKKHPDCCALVEEALDIIRTNLPAFTVWIEQAEELLGLGDGAGCSHVNTGPPCDECAAPTPKENQP